MKKRELLERDIEKDLNTKAARAGWWSLKFTSPQRRSVPDRILLGSVEKVEDVLQEQGVPHFGRRRLAELCMAATVTFAECKKPGVKPSIAQEREHAKLRARGFTVLVVDSKEQIDEMYGEDRGSDLV